MAFTPIPEGTPQWDVPLNAALVTQDTQLSTTTTTVASLQTQLNALQNQVTALSTIATGGSYYRLIAAADSSANVKSKADYVCDGSADQVEIQTAINAAQLEGGGVIQLSEGSFALSTPIIINGTTNEDNPLTVTLKGCGEFATYLRPTTNTNAISISNWAQLHLADFGIVIQGAGNGIVSQSVTTTDTRSFWASSFRNLRINGEYNPLNTGWAMDLAMPWRSVFDNIEIEGTRNGMKLLNEGTIQNAGDCTFTRMFIEIVGDGGTAIHISSPSNNMNQNNFNMIEAGASGPNCTGILIDGASGGASQRFWGTNLEQFKFLVNVANGESNVFDLNYVTCDNDNVTGNVAFQCGSAAFNNIFSAKWVNVPSGQTLTILDDNNTTMDNAPNLFSGIRIENNGGSVLYDKTSTTVFRDITTFNDGGTIQAGLLQYPTTSYESEGTFNVVDFGAVGDGVVDDIGPIQDAFDAADTAGGGIVLFPSGRTYAISTYMTSKSDITVMAYGATIIASADSGLFRNFVPTDSFAAYAGNSRISVYGGVWDANAANSGVGTVTSIRNAFTFSHGQDIILRDLTVQNVSSAHGVDLSGAKNVLISGCHFLGFKDNDGARGFSEAIQLDYAKTDSGGIGLDDNTPSIHITVDNCRFGASSRLGPFGRAVGSHTTTGASNWCENIIITNNVVEATARENIQAYGWKYATISNNSLQGVASSSFACVMVTGPDPGVAGYINVCDTVTVADNVIDGTGTLNGIRVSGFATARPVNVRVTGNTVDQSATTGIFVSQATAPSVEGNTVSDTTTAGIYIVNCTDPDAVGNKIVNATGVALGVDTCTRGQVVSNSVITTGSHGILVTAGSNVSVNGNRVYNAVGSGIRATTSTSRARIINNIVITAALGIDVTASAGNALVINNDLTGSGWAVGVALSLLGVPAPITDWTGGIASPGWNLVS